MTAAAPLGPRQAAIVEHLREHPGLTAGELARAFGLRAQLHKQLDRLQGRGLVAGVPVWNAAQGRRVIRWELAPPGSVPPPALPADPAEAERKRERDRKSQRTRRARARRTSGPRYSRRAGLPDWAAAACLGADPELFFPERGEPTEPARQVCARCPIRPACLAYALDTRQVFGVWGGADEAERRAMLRQALRSAS